MCGYYRPSKQVLTDRVLETHPRDGAAQIEYAGRVSFTRK